MPFPFTLPTTSSTSLADYYSSPSHPSLPLTATTHRSVLRDALKKHKRLPASSRASHLTTVQDALNAYIPYLLVLNAALTGQQRVAGERVEIMVSRELEVEWRLTISSTIPGREAPRVKLSGIHNELAFVLQTLAYVQVLLSRVHLFSIYNSASASPEQRSSAVSTAMKYLLEASSIHNFILSLPVPHVTSATTPGSMARPVDTSNPTQSALASLALSEATIVVVLKDDPYTAAVVEDRNKDSKEWMIKAPSIPKVRAHLFARLCLASADHAARASGLLAQAGKLDDDLVRYVEDLRRTARARAARFLGVDAEISGQTGEAIAWLRGGKKELGIAVSGDEDAGKRRGLKGLKQSWAERREDKRVERGDAEWGMDAGRLEEARVLEWLEARWGKLNDTINVQLVPPFESLLASMPSGREYHTPKAYTPPSLDVHDLARIRAPADPSQDAFRGNEADSGDESTAVGSAPVGAFPGTAHDYASGPAYY